MKIMEANIGKAFNEMTEEEDCECSHLCCERYYNYDEGIEEVNLCDENYKECSLDTDSEDE